MITWIAGVIAAALAVVIIAPNACKKLVMKLKGGEKK